MGQTVPISLLFVHKIWFIFFGEINDGEMVLNDVGLLAEKYWMEIPDHFLFVELGEFVVMPNHMHGIIVIDKPEDESLVEPGNETLRRDRAVPCLYDDGSVGKSRFRNQGKNTVSSIVGS